MTNYSRSVLLSNDFPHSKIQLKKFDFSLKTVPANIAKKLPLQLRPKPLFIAFFNFSYKRPTFAFTGKSGYTRSRTAAHTPKQECFPPSATARSCAASETHFIPPCFYIHTFPGSLWTPTISRGRKSGKVTVATLSQSTFHRVFRLLAQMAHVRFHE